MGKPLMFSQKPPFQYQNDGTRQFRGGPGQRLALTAMPVPKAAQTGVQPNWLQQALQMIQAARGVNPGWRR